MKITSDGRLSKRGTGRRAGVLLAVLCVVGLGCSSLAVSFAASSTAPEFLARFGKGGSQAGAGELNPIGVAANPANGHLYVAGAERIDELTSWGEFVKAWGWGVRDGQPELQTCTEATGCLSGLRGSGSGEFFGPSGITLDSSGNIYVVDQEYHRVQKFNPAGEFLLMFGGEVNQSKVEEAGSTESERNLCTQASANICQAGSTGLGSGQFNQWPAGTFIATDSNDVIYVGDENRIQKFDTGGHFIGEISLSGYGLISNLAIAPDDSIYLLSQNLPGVRKLNPLGVEVGTPLDESGIPGALAADATGNLYVVDNPFDVDGNSSPRVIEYDPSGLQVAEFAQKELNEVNESEHLRVWGIAAGLLGDGSNSPGDIYVSTAISEAVFLDGFLQVFGPSPQFEDPPAIAPSIDAQFAEKISTTGATLKAEIEPHHWETQYHLEYGLESCSSGTCQSLPSGILSNEARGIQPVTETLTGLLPGTTYHYRFVASSECEPGVDCTTEGQDRLITTGLDFSAGLPDSRVYEMVSPPNKNGGEVGVPTGAGGAAEATPQPQQSSPSGSAITYGSFTAFGPDPESAPATSQYLSKRGSSGWSTANINPRFEEGFVRDPFVGFSTDLTHAAVINIEPPLTSDATPGFPNLYQRNNEGATSSAALTAITTKAHSPEVVDPVQYCLFYGGTSDSSDRMVFAAKGALLEGDPVGEGFNLYEWTRSQGIKLLSVLPDGTPATPALGTGFGKGAGTSSCVVQAPSGGVLMRHAISSDGSLIFWTYSGFFGQFGVDFANSPLLARVNGSETVELDANQGGSAPYNGEGHYQDASADGSKVFFTDGLRLTPDSTAEGGAGSDLYRYDFDKPQGQRLMDLSANAGEAANVLGVLGVSSDGSYAYFVAKGALDSGAVPGQPNLYVWHEGDPPTYIATLAEADKSNWSDEPNKQTARVTPDGRHLAFVSRAPLSEFDNTGASTAGCEVGGQNRLFGSSQCDEVYLYDFGSPKVDCVSCNPTGARPLGPASVPTWSTPYEQPRYLSQGGERLFFQTFDSLDPHDTNSAIDKGKIRGRDVYEFERLNSGSCMATSETFYASVNGCLYLISTGVSSDESYFIDASESGNDAFISTRQGLVFTDQDGRFDIYDARVGGSGPTPPPPGCEGEGCRGAPTSPGGSLLPGTSHFQGPKTPGPKLRCGKGKRRVKFKGKRHAKRYGREYCVNVKAKKRHKRHKGHQRKRAAHGKQVGK